MIPNNFSSIVGNVKPVNYVVYENLYKLTVKIKVARSHSTWIKVAMSHSTGKMDHF